MRYWKKEGPENTQATVDLVVEKARDLNPQHTWWPQIQAKRQKNLLIWPSNSLCYSSCGFQKPW